MTIINMIVLFTVRRTCPFSGEGNASRNKAQTNSRFKDTLHYKGKRAMTFEKLLSQWQEMQKIAQKEKELMTEDANIIFLFQKV